MSSLARARLQCHRPAIKRSIINLRLIQLPSAPVHRRQAERESRSDSEIIFFSSFSKVQIKFGCGAHIKQLAHPQHWNAIIILHRLTMRTCNCSIIKISIEFCNAALKIPVYRMKINNFLQLIKINHACMIQFVGGGR